MALTTTQLNSLKVAQGRVAKGTANAADKSAIAWAKTQGWNPSSTIKPAATSNADTSASSGD